MLRLVNIKKDYVTASETVKALKGINLSFRQAEFVSILGPSGCGKTTLLNIIGGLDHYTSGDLIINGRSTKRFSDRDWDVYRNHRIGFIFQSYNLIPHQTVLGNVELALTISGVGKEERTRRAKEALDRVGLHDQYYKRPNQLSGGQCQRVAIARALVNNPEILLADEPTGALDTATSVQIMDLIREIASERLVIMVTHNPELAQQYSTRIIRLLDGEVIEDTNPFSEEQEKAECRAILSRKIRAERDAISRGEHKRGRKEKAKMSFFTAFRLSARNLFSKRGRTAMVGFAGSIGIIGIALVLAFSAGIRGYVDSMQDDMLSGNPITVTEQTRDMTALMSMISAPQNDQIEKIKGNVYISSLIEYIAKTQSTMQGSLIKNDITANYIDFIEQMPEDTCADILYGYGLDVQNNIYTDFSEQKGGSANNYSISTLRNVYTGILSKTDFSRYASYIGMLVNTFQQAPSNEEYLLSQYNILEGEMADEKNEIMLVIDKDQTLSDLLLANLGYYSQDEFLNIIYKANEKDKDEDGDGVVDEYVNYDPTLDRESFTYAELLGKTFVYHPNDAIYTATGNAMAPFTYENDGSAVGTSDDAVELRVVGILQPKANISFGALTAGIYYTEALTEHILECSADSEIVTYLTESGQSSFTCYESINYDKEGNVVSEIRTGIFYEFSYTYEDTVYTEYALVGEDNSMMSALSSMMGVGQSTAQTKNATLSQRNLGGNSLPNSISIYPLNFDKKDAVIEYLDEWNGDGTVSLGEGRTLAREERSDIKYTDTISTIVAMINTMINIITYALVAFTSISLVVSTVMIGIITYVSVVERIKEIGVIRALGGRKRDVSHLFNAETFILGLLSGGFGIGVTYLVSFIASLIVEHLTAVPNIAALPWEQAVLLIVLSVLLTSISGIIPASSAAKKDPVVALRTE